MKHCFTFIVILLLLISCNDINKHQWTENHQVIKNEYEFLNFFEGIKIIDTTCENQTKAANQDIDKGKVSFNMQFLEFYPWWSPKKYMNYDYLEKSLSGELNKFNIDIDTTLLAFSDIRSPFDGFFKKYCYQQTMRDYIQNKYGSKFLDSIIFTIEKNYVLEHPDEIYSVSDTDRKHDYRIKRDLIFFGDYNTKMNIDFALEFIYPKDYKPKNEKSFSYTSAYFILYKNGTIDELEVESTFQNPENEKFRGYFEGELRKFVSKSKWISPTCSGIKVNTQMRFLVHHK